MFLWDYDEKKLKKSPSGKRLILERLINYGPGKKKINLEEVKKNWNKLSLWPSRKKLFELLIWGKIQPLARSKKSFWMK